MPTTTRPKPAPESVAAAAHKSWYQFKHFNPASAQDPRLSYLSGYQRCASDMLADLFQFGGWDSLTRRLLEVFEQLVIEREAIRMVTDETEEPV